jgi:hypothetical protein
MDNAKRLLSLTLNLDIVGENNIRIDQEYTRRVCSGALQLLGWKKGPVLFERQPLPVKYLACLPHCIISSYLDAITRRHFPDTGGSSELQAHMDGGWSAVSSYSLLKGNYRSLPSFLNLVTTLRGSSPTCRSVIERMSAQAVKRKLDKKVGDGSDPDKHVTMTH